MKWPLRRYAEDWNNISTKKFEEKYDNRTVVKKYKI